MKILEEIEVLNEDKVFIGHKDIKLTLDTETGQVSIDTPAMMPNPVVSLTVLEEKIGKLREHMDR